MIIFRKKKKAGKIEEKEKRKVLTVIFLLEFLPLITYTVPKKKTRVLVDLILSCEEDSDLYELSSYLLHIQFHFQQPDQKLNLMEPETTTLH